MRMIPGITDAEVSRWLSQRATRPFASADDFKQRTQLSKRVLGTMKLRATTARLVPMERRPHLAVYPAA